MPHWPWGELGPLQRSRALDGLPEPRPALLPTSDCELPGHQPPEAQGLSSGLSAHLRRCPQTTAPFPQSTESGNLGSHLAALES